MSTTNTTNSTASGTSDTSAAASTTGASTPSRVIKLSIDSLKVLDKKKRWDLFFTVVTTHPTDANKTLVGVFPADGEEIQLKPHSDNHYSFVPKEAKPGDGLEMLSLTNPTVLQMDVQVYVKNKGALARAADVISDLTAKMNATSFETLPGFLGKAATWISVQGAAIGDVIKVIENLPDRSMGLVDMGQNLTELTAASAVQTRSNNTSTNEVEFTWTWALLQ